jgi:hypothetical protein
MALLGLAIPRACDTDRVVMPGRNDTVALEVPINDMVTSDRYGIVVKLCDVDITPALLTHAVCCTVSHWHRWQPYCTSREERARINTFHVLNAFQLNVGD